MWQDGVFWKNNFSNIMKKEDLINNVKPLFTLRQRFPDRCSWILLVPAKMRQLLMKTENIRRGWHNGTVSDYLEPSRCFKCQKFGHISGKCKEQQETCSVCAAHGHNRATCTAPKDQFKCANCKNAGIPHEHSVRSQECPIFKAILQRNITYIDYGV